MPPKKADSKQQPKKGKLENTNKGSKKAAKKWSKGRSREALQNAVMFEKSTLDRLNTEVPKFKVITPAIISDRLKVSVALAAKGLQHLCSKGVIRLVARSSKFCVYTRNVTAEPAAAAAAPAASGKGGKAAAAPAAAE